MSIHFIVQFEPIAGKEATFREEMLWIVEATRTESGCLAIHGFESLREPWLFAIHSEWIDEAAFERHCELPHTVRFLEATKDSLTHPVQGLRSREIVGGAGAAVSSHVHLTTD